MIIAMCMIFLSLSQVLYKLWSRFLDCTEPLQACKVAVKVLLESRDMEALNRYWDHWSGSVNCLLRFRHWHWSASTIYPMRGCQRAGLHCISAKLCFIEWSSVPQVKRLITSFNWPFKKLIVVWVYLWESPPTIELMWPFVQPLKLFLPNNAEFIHWTTAAIRWIT